MIRLPQRPITRAAALAVAMTLVFGGILGLDAAETRGRPLEHARVLSHERTGERIMCHKVRDDEYAVTLRSYNPPPGLPATFEHDGYCDPETVGTVVPLVRVPHDDHVEIYTYPLRGADEVGTVLGGFSVLVFLALWLAFTATRAHDQWRERRSERRRAARTGTIG